MLPNPSAVKDFIPSAASTFPPPCHWPNPPPRSRHCLLQHLPVVSPPRRASYPPRRASSRRRRCLPVAPPHCAASSASPKVSLYLSLSLSLARARARLCFSLSRSAPSAPCCCLMLGLPAGCEFEEFFFFLNGTILNRISGNSLLTTANAKSARKSVPGPHGHVPYRHLSLVRPTGG